MKKKWGENMPKKWRLVLGGGIILLELLVAIEFLLIAESNEAFMGVQTKSYYIMGGMLIGGVIAGLLIISQYLTQNKKRE